MTLELVRSTSDSPDNEGDLVIQTPSAGNILVFVAVDYRSTFVAPQDESPVAGKPLVGYMEQDWVMFDSNNFGWDYQGSTETDTGTSFAVWTRLATGEETSMAAFHLPTPTAERQSVSGWCGEFTGVRASEGSRQSAGGTLTTPDFANDFLNQISLHVWAYDSEQDDPDPTLDTSSLTGLGTGDAIGDLQIVRNDDISLHNDDWQIFTLAIQATTYDTNGDKDGLTLLPGPGTPTYEEEFIPGGYNDRGGSITMTRPFGYTRQYIPGPRFNDPFYSQIVLPSEPTATDPIVDPLGTNWDFSNSESFTNYNPGSVPDARRMPPEEDDSILNTQTGPVEYPLGFEDDYFTQTVLSAADDPDAAVLVARYPAHHGTSFIGGPSDSGGGAGLTTTIATNTQVVEIGTIQILTVFMQGGAGFQGQEGLTISDSDNWTLTDYWQGVMREDVMLPGPPPGATEFAAHAATWQPEEWVTQVRPDDNATEFYVFIRRATSATNESINIDWTGQRYTMWRLYNVGDATHHQSQVPIGVANPYYSGGKRTKINFPVIETVDDDALVLREAYVVAARNATENTHPEWYPMFGDYNDQYDSGTKHIDAFLGWDDEPYAGPVPQRAIWKDASAPGGLVYAFTYSPDSDPLEAPDEEGNVEEPEELLVLADDVDYYQVQLARDAGFTNIVRTQRVEKGTSKTFRVKKPRDTRFYARVRSVNELGTKSTWTTNDDKLENPPQADEPSLSFDKNEDNEKLRAKVTTNVVTWDEEDISRYEFVLKPAQWTKLDQAVSATNTTFHVKGPNTDYTRPWPNTAESHWLNDLPYGQEPTAAYPAGTEGVDWFYAYIRGETVRVEKVQGALGHTWIVTRGIVGGNNHPKNTRVRYFTKDDRGKSRGIRKQTVHAEDPDEETTVTAVFAGIPNGVNYKARVRAISRDGRQGPFSEWCDALKSADGATTGDVGGGGGGEDPGDDDSADPTAVAYPYERIYRCIMDSTETGYESDDFTPPSNGDITAVRVECVTAPTADATFDFMVNGASVSEATIAAGYVDSGFVYIDSPIDNDDILTVVQTDPSDVGPDITAYFYVTLDATA